MLIKIIKHLILIIGILYLVLIFLDAIKHKDAIKNERGNVLFLSAAEIVTWFLATFGVSDTALNMLFYRIKKTVDIKQLPGTIIVSATVPMCIMSYTYMGTIQVDSVTLLLLTLSQAFGAYLGAKFITKLNIDRIKLFMSIALLGSAFLIFAKQFLLGIDGGNMTGLTKLPLIFAAAVFVILGALSMIGLGPTTPNMSLLLLFGMSPSAVYPIIMTANAVGCIVGCISFIISGTYHKKASLSASIFGIIGVMIAVTLVKNMNLKVLQILMIIVLIYSAVSLMYTPKNDKKNSIAV